VYKYNNPIEWFSQYIDQLDQKDLKKLLLEFAGSLDFDTLIDIFQSEMVKDGYFDPIEQEQD
jgi:hypothetical protein